MIIGIGNDLVLIVRIQRAITRWGLERFCRRIFTEDEFHRLKSHSATHIAGRFAGKEAIFKAVSATYRLGWRDFCILKPVQSETLKVELVSGTAKDRLKGIEYFLSISHDGEYASAFALAQKK